MDWAGIDRASDLAIVFFIHDPSSRRPVAALCTQSSRMGCRISSQPCSRLATSFGLNIDLESEPSPSSTAESLACFTAVALYV